MQKDNTDFGTKCPRCGDFYTNYPAISRRDNKTEICPHCGHEEALYDFTHSKRGVNTHLPLEVYTREAVFTSKLKTS